MNGKNYQKLYLAVGQVLQYKKHERYSLLVR